jgi:hypothetical protein
MIVIPHKHNKYVSFNLILRSINLAVRERKQPTDG